AAAARLGDAVAQAQRRLADPGLYQPRSGLLMQAVLKIFRWFAAVLGLLVCGLLVVIGVLQTQPGRDLLAKKVAQALSSPDFIVTIEGLGGIVPYRMTAERIEIADRDGKYLTLRDFGLDISAGELLSGRAHIRSLSFAEIEMARSSTAPSTTPLTEYL